jgi:MFS family permease
MSDIAARIERLPFFAAHRRLLLMGGLGYVFAAMEGAVIAFVMPIVRVRWSLSSVEVGLIGSSVLIGYFFGAFLAGTLGDVIGRRAVMMWSLVIYCVAALASALVDSWIVFFWLRVIAGSAAARKAPSWRPSCRNSPRGSSAAVSPARWRAFFRSASSARRCLAISWCRPSLLPGAW